MSPDISRKQQYRYQQLAAFRDQFDRHLVYVKHCNILYFFIHNSIYCINSQPNQNILIEKTEIH